MRTTRPAIKAIAAASLLALGLGGCSQSADGPESDTANAADTATLASESITADSFGCIRDLEAVDRFFVGNLNGDLEATLAVARAGEGTYPVGSIVQLVPTEAMVKRAAGFSEATKDWEFFDIDISAEGNTLLARGHADVNNRFGNNCLECHAKAEEKFDMICSTDNGCDPIPITDAMIRGLQKTDPRCDTPAELTDEEKEGLAALQAMMGS